MLTDPRLDAGLAWAAGELGQRMLEHEPVSGDASFRRYFRVRSGQRTWILMDAPPENEDVGPFLRVAELLREAGVHVPEIIAADPQRGFLLLSDLGTSPYHKVIDAHSAPALLGDAVNALVRIQLNADKSGLPAYDAALLQGELDLFPDWFLSRHWQVEPAPDEHDAWNRICAMLVRQALDQPVVFCHRDYMPRNLMLADPNPGILDFQDAVAGPLSYDPVCLFRDAFLSWPEDLVDRWLEDYRSRALAAGLPVPPSADEWKQACDLMGVQRHLKVIGIFARIRYRDGKPGYVEDTPRFFTYLRHAIERNRELAELGRLLAAWEARRNVTENRHSG